MISLKGMRFPIDVIMDCILWYAAYPLSYRRLEEMMEERGFSVDHSSISRWVMRFLPLIEKVSRKHKLPVGSSWRMDETYIKVKGVWKYLYRAVDKHCKSVDFLLTAKRDMTAAKRFFDKALAASGSPGMAAMDKSSANKSAIDELDVDRAALINVRQVKYLNNIVEHDHRAIKRVTRPMLGFKSFRSARNVLAGIELIHMIRKRRFAIDSAPAMFFADHFYALAGLVCPARGGDVLSTEKST